MRAVKDVVKELAGLNKHSIMADDINQIQNEGDKNKTQAALTLLRNGFSKASLVENMEVAIELYNSLSGIANEPNGSKEIGNLKLERQKDGMLMMSLGTTSETLKMETSYSRHALAKAIVEASLNINDGQVKDKINEFINKLLEPWGNDPERQNPNMKYDDKHIALLQRPI